MKLFFLLNPSSHKKHWDYREMAARAAQRNGWTPRFGEVDRQNPNSTDHLLLQAWEEGCTRLTVVGGDGTLHRVINTLKHQKRLSQMEVAVVPGGTCNDFARALGLRRRRMEEAFRLACTGKSQATDIGMMDSELFLNNAGIGRRMSGARVAGKPLSTLQNFRPILLRAQWDKGALEGHFFMALVCNSRFFSGGLYFSKAPQTNDGYLDVYLLPPMPKWRLLPLLVLGKLGRAAGSRRLIKLRVQRLEIQAQSDLWPQADGEPSVKAVRRVVFSVAPEKAMIVTPER